jgi:hypothetical protein
MKNRQQIKVQLVKLAGGQRLLSVTDRDSRLSLEKKLDPNQPVVAQRQLLLNVFAYVLTQVDSSRPC